MKLVLIRWLVAGSALLLVGLIGCQDSPVAPISSGEQSFTPLTATILDDPIKLCARIRTADHNQRRLTLDGHQDTVVAYQNCQITRFKEGGDAPIPFDSLRPGDSVEVNGERNMDGYVYAYKIKVLEKNSYGNCDLAFRDTIVAIDLAAGSFTVLHRTETILVDANTVIWDVIRQWSGGDGGFKAEGPSDVSNGEGQEHPEHFTYFTLADLETGDVVEIRANVVDDVTLLAVSVKMTSCDPQQKCTTFESVISTIDADARIVTFTDNAWIGWVAGKARLLDAAGLPITLADFAAGDAVAVKGIPMVGDTLRICELSKM